MLMYLGLVVVLCIAAFLVALRSAEWFKMRRGMTADSAAGLFIMVFLGGLVLVSVFVVVAADLTQKSHMPVGLLAESVLATVFFPLGILILKKKQDFA